MGIGNTPLNGKLRSGAIVGPPVGFIRDATGDSLQGRTHRLPMTSEKRANDERDAPELNVPQQNRMKQYGQYDEHSADNVEQMASPRIASRYLGVREGFGIRLGQMQGRYGTCHAIG